ncbi:condensation domain-containing protein, partial [Paenactinomyces guangxiensis]
MVDKSQINGLYGLSPLQQGMLFHYLDDPNNTAYFQQTAFSIEGSLDLSSLKESIQDLIRKYDTLRTVFLYENLNQPIQVVLKERKAEVVFQDLSTLNDEEKQSCIDEFKRKDRERGFDLSRDLLIRFALLQTDSQNYQLILSFHHILMDGWCMGILIDDLLHMYQQRIKRQPIVMEKVPSYGEYIRWLKEQDQEQACAYWNQYLEGYEQLTGIPIQERKGNHNYIQSEISFDLGTDLTSKLTKLARMQQVTLNTVFQTVWGLLLQKYNDTREAVFGAVVSVRPTEIRDVEKSVGLFINTIPVRIRSRKQETFSRLLQEVQQAALNVKPYHYVSLAEIQSNRSQSAPLIDHIMVFENFPFDKSVFDRELGFRITDVEIFEQTNYDFNVIIHPDETLAVKFVFNKEIYSPEFVQNMFNHLQQVVKLVVANPHIPVEEIEIVSVQEKQ